MKENKAEDYEKQKDFIISDALVAIKNSVILGQNYIEHKEEIPEFTPLYTVFEQIDNALKKVEPYYDEINYME